MIAETAIPAFAMGVKFRFDPVRNTWVVLAPERLFLPDEQATEILKLVDAKRPLSAIIDTLADRFGAPRDVVAADITAMLQDLIDKGAIRL